MTPPGSFAHGHPIVAGQPRAPIHLTHLGTRVLSFGDEASPCTGQTLWGDDNEAQSAGVAWDWVRLHAGRRRHVRSAGPRHQPEAARRSRRGLIHHRGRSPVASARSCLAMADRGPARLASGGLLSLSVWSSFYNALDRPTAQPVASANRCKYHEGLQRMLSARRSTVRLDLPLAFHGDLSPRSPPTMKEYRLLAWPELPAEYRRTAHRRALERDVAAVHEPGQAGRGQRPEEGELRAFVDMLDGRAVSPSAIPPPPTRSSTRSARSAGCAGRCNANHERPLAAGSQRPAPAGAVSGFPWRG